MYRNYSLVDFLNVDMTGKVILSIQFPVFSATHIYRCFKVLKLSYHLKSVYMCAYLNFTKLKRFLFRIMQIARRYQNSHADVNAGILFNVDKKNNFKVLSKPSICFGGISSTYV